MFLKNSTVFCLVAILLAALAVSLPCRANDSALSGLDTAAGATASNPSSPTDTSSSSSSSSAASSSSASQGYASWTGYVTASALNVRSAPWGTIVDCHSKGTSVTVVGVNASDSQWYDISTSGGTRCVHSSYISKSGGSSSSTASSSSSSGYPWTGYVTASALNVRTSPWGSVTGTLSRGEEVSVQAVAPSDSQWYDIGSGKFVFASYISRTRPSDSSGSGSGTASGATFTSGPKSQRILDGMRSLVDSWLDYPAACGYDYQGNPSTRGNLGCAYAVSMALKKAGINAYSLGVTDLSNKLQKQPDPGFQRLAASQRQPGDIIIWGGHIGVEAGGGRALSNSSSRSTVREHSDTYMTIQYVLRAPA